MVEKYNVWGDFSLDNNNSNILHKGNRMEKSPCQGELFSEVLQKKDNQYKLWISKAAFQLKIRGGKNSAYCSTGEDIVHDIILGILCGRIIWDSERVPNINTFMHHQIRSQVSNLVRSERMKIVPYRRLGDDPSIPKYIDADKVWSEPMENILEEQDRKELREKILSELSDDVLGHFVFEEIIEGSGNKWIAEDLGIAVKDVVNAKRRIAAVIQREYYVEG
jgi:hypothetical protein